MNEKDHILSFRKFLEPLQVSEREWDTFKEYYELRFLPKNEYFVSTGKVCRRLAFIAEGIIRYCMFREDGTDATCFFMCENDFAGDPESFFLQRPSEMNAQALTDCWLITISYENMQLLLQKNPRIKEINAFIDHYVMTKMLYQRTFLLNLDATARYREFMKEFPDILQRIPLGHVANFLGITQQSLSRLRKQIS